MMAKAKRKMSPAQKAALAKGRAALAKKRGKKTSSPAKRKAKRKAPPREKATIIKTVAVPVPVRKKRRKSVSKTSNSRGAVMATKKKSSTGNTVRKAGSRAKKFIQESGFLETVKNTSLLIAGGVASAVIVNRVPLKDARIKAALPIVVGMGLAGTIGKTNDLARQVATGMMAIGMISLFKKLAPNVPMLAGEEVYYLPQYGAGYGCLPDYSGDSVDLSGNVNLMGYDTFLTPASF